MASSAEASTETRFPVLRRRSSTVIVGPSAAKTGITPERSQTPRFSLRRAATVMLQPEKPVGPPPTILQGLKSIFVSSWLNLLVLLLPVAWTLHLTKASPALVFSFSYLAIIPLGNFIAMATEELSMRLGSALGTLLAVTMGNSVELISAIIALRSCELRVVQSSLMGSMLSNLLLVLGLSFFAGGIRFAEQGLSSSISQINSSLLALTVIAVLLPAAFHFSVDQGALQNGQPLSDTEQGRAILQMSHGAAIVLLSLYGFFLVFQLMSHKYMYDEQHESRGDKSESVKYPATSKKTAKNAIPMTRQNGNVDLESQVGEPEEEEEEEAPRLSVMMSVVLLVLTIGLTATSLEWFVGSIGSITASGSISKEWVGLILLPLLSGNTSERIKSVTSSIKDKLHISVKAAVGSSIQIALFIIPTVICLGWITDKPLTLLFDPFECVTLFFTVLTLNYIVANGKTHWIEGIILLHLYLLVAVSFWFYPGYDPTSSLLNCR